MSDEDQASRRAELESDPAVAAALATLRTPSLSSEPENGERVAIDTLNDIRIYKRLDDLSPTAGQPERRWWLVSRPTKGDGAYARTWQELTEMGAIAYVGQFVKRSARTEGEVA
jgi:hypothetical protein